MVSRGVVQVSSYVDAVLASLLPSGALAALSYAQILYTLPVSLFGIAVSASELPAMAGATGDRTAVAAHLRGRLDGGLRRIAFHVIPSAVAFAALGHVLAGAIFQSGQFTADDSYYVWGILAGSSVGLLATTTARLYSSAFYALQDTRTPFRFAVVRVSSRRRPGCRRRAAAARCPGNSPTMGRGGAHRGGEPGWMGGADTAPPGAGAAHRAHRARNRVRNPVLGRGHARGRGGGRHLARTAASPPRGRRGGRRRGVRAGLLRRRGRPGRGSSTPAAAAFLSYRNCFTATASPRRHGGRGERRLMWSHHRGSR